jgi:hypothetical protein
LPKPRPSHVKRQREIAKKQQREAKLQRKRDRKAQSLQAAPDHRPLGEPPGAPAD